MSKLHDMYVSIIIKAFWPNKFLALSAVAMAVEMSLSEAHLCGNLWAVKPNSVYHSMSVPVAYDRTESFFRSPIS